MRIFEHFEQANGFAPDWTFGGGTALMLQIDHRESHDIDLFLDDPQILPFLNPDTQGIVLDRQPDGYDSDGAGVLKLVYAEWGEIDFICCASITEHPAAAQMIHGWSTALETPAEIIAKKVYYRGWNFQPRDMFDLAAVVERLGRDYAAAALEACGAERLATALDVVQASNPAFVEAINGQLMVRSGAEHLVNAARDITLDVLRRL
ncbi:nucleotidyl transferase AbiEii/AbiGii toxin family protein [Sphingomonas crocodyli]|uniref:Nucleotidyl transferase AbiEii/AbiGii toxin family protein n=1 Tax=Sphingomonas crocodyli TaxID=1979270 RepID=A0A437LYL9_9SPHN|nr:nucleotidyl transferase AbiEii/AbiGii toxin family protein [Sphingomonas crocodyli]RVT90436.1 hypothetical protein EOD43_19470 [Sphingomonas crocodyli]